MPVLFALTLFTSAVLVFSIQPMVAKAVLPAFGGTPAVWNTCMVFFQTVLLAGYAYAHALTGGLSPRRQRLAHACLVGVGLVLVALVMAPADFDLSPDESRPVLWLLRMLAVTVGVPFLAVSATAPLLQRWFAETHHPSARDPYFLYAASNLGSLLALIAYPTLIEPRLTLSEQRLCWQASYGVLVLLIATCAARAVSGQRPADREKDKDSSTEYPVLSTEYRVLTTQSSVLSPQSFLQRLHWLALAFVPASLLYGVTTFLTTDLASVPLLWVIPLALYLLTFILAFSSPGPRVQRLVLQLFPLFVLGQTFVFAIQGLRPLWLLPGMHLLTFFVVALACHGELARQRPHPGHLTEFYLWLSLGGVLGGLFNTLAAPLLFESLAEYPLALVLACFLVPVSAVGKRKLDWQDLWLPLILFLLAASLIPVFRERVTSLPLRVSLIYGLPAAVCYTFINRPVRFGLGVGAILLAGAASGGEAQSKLVYRARSFFGIVRVLDVPNKEQPESRLRRFVHGSTLHGMQRIGPDGKANDEPLTYYFRNGPIGEFFASRNERPTKNVAVLGLGAGTLAAYARGGQEWTFYEIDPAVEHVARNYYSYLGDAGQRGVRWGVEIGDGRLRLKQAADVGFDVIFADAFSSDSVPVHLLTREAMRLYVDKLAAGGVLVVNITNRCLDLEPVVANLAHDVGLVGLVREERAEGIGEADRRAGKTPSRWVVLARAEADLGSLADNPRWRALRAREDVGVWTDDYSNLIRVLRW